MLTQTCLQVTQCAATMRKRPAAVLGDVDDDVSCLKRKLEDALKSNAELACRLEAEVDKNRELTKQLEVLREGHMEVYSRSIPVSLISGEQFTISVPATVDPDDITRAVDDWLKSKGKAFEDFQVLQNDREIYDIDEPADIKGPFTVIVIEAALSDCEHDGDNFLESMWDIHDGVGQPSDVPAGTYQFCYWTDGANICRVKQADGKWQYWTEDR